MESILIFTDGACSGNPGPGGWGAIVRVGDRVRELGGADPRTTNNRMEMIAAAEALESARGERQRPVELFTDSTYLIHGITRWVAGWKRRGWKRADGGPVLNRDLWERLDALDAERRGAGQVEWKFVKGHAGSPGNERCDEIAVDYSQGRVPVLYEGPAPEYRIDLDRRPPAGTARTAEPAKGSAPSKRFPARGGGRPVYLSLLNGVVERHPTWAACDARVKGKSGARYRKATSPEQEAEILRGWGVSPGSR